MDCFRLASCEQALPWLHRIRTHVFLDQLLRQGTLTRWLVQRRRDHRASLGLPIGALDPVERMFGEPLRAAAAQPPASDSAPAAATAAAADARSAKDGKRKPVGATWGGTGALEQLPQYWTVHMDKAEADVLGLLHRVS